MSKDWTGNKNSTFKTLGSSHHSEHDREENDYYATEPRAVSMLLDLENFNVDIWEPACGEGHIAKVLEDFHCVKSTDLIDRGYGLHGIDFLNQTEIFNGDIITNPPYKFAKEFIEKALSLIPEGNKVAMFLKLQFLEGKGRKKMFIENPPIRIWVSSSRLICAMNGKFNDLRISGGSVAAYAWYIWEKGFKGDPIIKWFN